MKERRQEEGGDVYLLWHLCSRDNDLSSEREYSRLFPVGVSVLLILINRKTAEGLGVGFHSLNQYIITGQITSSEQELALMTSTWVHLCLPQVLHWTWTTSLREQQIRWLSCVRARTRLLTLLIVRTSLRAPHQCHCRSRSRLIMNSCNICNKAPACPAWCPHPKLITRHHAPSIQKVCKENVTHRNITSQPHSSHTDLPTLWS